MKKGNKAKYRLKMERDTGERKTMAVEDKDQASTDSKSGTFLGVLN